MAGGYVYFEHQLATNLLSDFSRPMVCCLVNLESLGGDANSMEFVVGAYGENLARRARNRGCEEGRFGRRDGLTERRCVDEAEKIFVTSLGLMFLLFPSHFLYNHSMRFVLSAHQMQTRSRCQRQCSICSYLFSKSKIHNAMTTQHPPLNPAVSVSCRLGQRNRS
jgi:hypothetical protein